MLCLKVLIKKIPLHYCAMYIVIVYSHIKDNAQDTLKIRMPFHALASFVKIY